MSPPSTPDAETRILLVEDDLAFTALILAYLSEFPNIKLDSASTLTAGLDHLRRDDYDAILLDLNLSDSRGVVTLKTMREHAPRVPIVVLTSTDEDDLAIQLLQNGAEEYVVKSSVRLNKLVRVIKVAIERKRVTERLGLLESVVLNTNDAVVIAEHNKGLPKEGRKIVFINETFTKLSQYQFDEIVGKPIAPLFAPSSEQSAMLDANAEQGSTVQTEVPHIRKDGTQLDVDLSMFPVIDESGTITHWVFMFRDATERKDSEETQRQILLMKQREDFAAVLAHDLKTPVIGTNRLLGILLSDTLGPLTKEQRDLLLLMQKDSEHSLQKIQNVLEVFRFNVSKNELKLVPIDLVPIINDCIAQQKARATARGDLQFKVDSPESVPNVVADEAAVRKILTNILDNATEFSPTNATITLKVTDARDSVSISVHDHGPGIAKDLQPFLFDRVWQGGPKTQYTASTGLGLYVCKQLIKAHDGTIECVSETGNNSSCTIIITLKKRSDA
ncbi:MAG: response regulator [Cyanobacteria bacterium SZAS-4]|nr:response regulator [Cyanobacteria bacterium SZAS-4]